MGNLRHMAVGYARWIAMINSRQYGVNFVGYSAYVETRDDMDEFSADINFVAGGASVTLDGAYISARSRTELRPFLRQIAAKRRRLETLIREAETSGREVQDGQFSVMLDSEAESVILEADDNYARLPLGTKLDRFIRKFSKRLDEIDDILRQAEDIGSKIERRPYQEYIDDFKRDGFFWVEGHGLAIYEGGKLNFTPRRQVGKVYPADAGGTEFMIELLDLERTH